MNVWRRLSSSSLKVNRDNDDVQVCNPELEIISARISPDRKRATNSPPSGSKSKKARIARESKSDTGLGGFFRRLIGMSSKSSSDDVSVVECSPPTQKNKFQFPIKHESLVDLTVSSPSLRPLERSDSVIIEKEVINNLDSTTFMSPSSNASTIFKTPKSIPSESRRRRTMTKKDLHDSVRRSQENSKDDDDEISIVAEVHGSPEDQERYRQERKSVEMIMNAFGVAENPIAISDDQSNSSGSISIISNGLADSPAPEDSISRQTTPKFHARGPKTPRSDRWTRIPTVHQKRQIFKTPRAMSPRVMREIPQNLTPARYQELIKATGAMFASPRSDQVDSERGHEEIRYVGTFSPSPTVTKPKPLKRLDAAGNVASGFYTRRIMKILNQVPKRNDSGIERRVEEQSSSGTVTLSPTPTSSGRESPSLSTSSFSSSASRAKMDDMIAQLNSVQLKTPIVQKKYEKFKVDLSGYKNREIELSETSHICGEARLKNRADVNDYLRKDLELLGIIAPKLVPKKDEFPPLTEEDNDLYATIMGRGNEGEVFAEGFSAKISRKDLQTLKGLNWLNDEVINFYLQMVCHRSTEDMSLPKAYAFNTFFLVNLIQKGYDSVKRWTRKVDIFAHKILLVPVHERVHWCMAVINIEEKRIEYYDSMHGNGSHYLTSLKEYLRRESLDKKKLELDLSDWELIQHFDCPRQQNGSDCGVFACKFAEFASRHAEVVFDQSHMPYYRKRMVVEIARKQLM